MKELGPFQDIDRPNLTLNNDLITMANHPEIQNLFEDDLVDPQLFRSFSGTGGSIDVSEGLASMTITTSVGSYYTLRSDKIMAYKPSTNVVSRQTAQFDSNAVDNSLQFIGMGTSADDIYIVMNGNEFGVRYSRGGKHEIRKLTVTANPSGTENITINLDGTEFTGTIESSGDLEFTANQIETMTTYTGYIVQHIADAIIFASSAVGAAQTGTFSFASDGTAEATFSTLSTANPLTTVFVAKDNFNGDKSTINRLDPFKLNLYEIEYSFYGLGSFIFKLYDSFRNKFYPLHTFRFDNRQSQLSLTRGDLFIQQGVASLGSTTSLTLKTAGYSASYLGINALKTTPRYSVDSSKSISADTEKVILVLSHRLHRNGYLANKEIALRELSVAADGNKPVLIKIYKDPTTLGAGTSGDFTNPQYVNETYSFTLFDTDVNTYTGGIKLTSYYFGKNQTAIVDLRASNINIASRQTYFITALSTGNSDIDLTVAFTET